jgi:ubiquinone/menaquinone biosynthesis C-methylase UbiE
MSKYTVMFGAGAESYSVFRPTYPPELYDSVLKFSSAGPDKNRHLAVDVATGTGQAAKDLAKHYRRVIAIDGNGSQISHAVKAENVEYRVADAHNTGLDGNIADVVTVAQALHW